MSFSDFLYKQLHKIFTFDHLQSLEHIKIVLSLHMQKDLAMIKHFFIKMIKLKKLLGQQHCLNIAFDSMQVSYYLNQCWLLSMKWCGIHLSVIWHKLLKIPFIEMFWNLHWTATLRGVTLQDSNHCWCLSLSYCQQWWQNWHHDGFHYWHI